MFDTACDLSSFWLLDRDCLDTRDVAIKANSG
jgi:hypothetical protein